MALDVKNFERLYAKDRRAWREWLEKNHAIAPGVWLIYYKKDSGKPRVSYDDAVEEALCFGWIDSKPNSIDDERFMQLFTPRKPKSPWAASNKKRADKLIKQGLMTPAGLEKIEAAKKCGSWNRYDIVDKLELPEDLKKALRENEAASKYFNALSNSRKKAMLYRISDAKRPETRAKRIEEAVRLAAENIQAYRYEK
jgi:uncharacterized protein YdeI (YjbR/CyaY-like superfamily)